MATPFLVNPPNGNYKMYFTFISLHRINAVILKTSIITKILLKIFFSHNYQSLQNNSILVKKYILLFFIVIIL